jgi:hypothetical protein
VAERQSAPAQGGIYVQPIPTVEAKFSKIMEMQMLFACLHKRQEISAVNVQIQQRVGWLKIIIL